MKSFELAPDVDQNLILAPAIRQTRPLIESVVGPTTSARWEFQQRNGPRELVLRLTDGERQSEESFRPSELSGNGAFEKRLIEMRDALAHNGEWRVAVRELMKDVLEWSRQLPGVNPSQDTVTLNEERSGRYELPRLTIESGGATMRVEPIAGWVMTPKWVEEAPNHTSKAVGRVDLKGPGGPIYLYYLLPEKWWVYRARDLDPAADPILFYPVDSKSFLQLAQVCLDA
jgi:hypothetical protein